MTTAIISGYTGVADDDDQREEKASEIRDVQTSWMTRRPATTVWQDTCIAGDDD